MKKNDLIKTEDGIYRILSIEANRVLAIDCIKKTMPKFYPVSSFGNGKNIDCIPVDFTDMEDLCCCFPTISAPACRPAR